MATALSTAATSAIQTFGPSLYNFAYYGAAACLVNLFHNVEVTFALPGSTDSKKEDTTKGKRHFLDEELSKAYQVHTKAKEIIRPYIEHLNRNVDKVIQRFESSRPYSEPYTKRANAELKKVNTIIDKLQKFSKKFEEFDFSNEEALITDPLRFLKEFDELSEIVKIIAAEKKTLKETEKNLKGIFKEISETSKSKKEDPTQVQSDSFCEEIGEDIIKADNFLNEAKAQLESDLVNLAKDIKKTEKMVELSKPYGTANTKRLQDELKNLNTLNEKLQKCDKELKEFDFSKEEFLKKAPSDAAKEMQRVSKVYKSISDEGIAVNEATENINGIFKEIAEVVYGELTEDEIQKLSLGAVPASTVGSFRFEPLNDPKGKELKY